MSRQIKIVIAVLGTALILVGGYLAYQYYISEPVANTPANAPVSAGEASDSQTSGAKLLSADSIFDFWVSSKDGGIYYASLEGQISRLDADGGKQSITSQKIPNLNKIIPSSDGSMALIESGYPQTPAFSILSIAKRSFQVMPGGTTAANWASQSNNKIAYLKNSGSGSTLGTLDVNSGKTTDLTKINQKDLMLEWPTADLIYLSDRPSSSFGGSAWSYNIKTKAFKAIAKDESGLSIKWWPGKELGLKWGGKTLTLINTNGQNIADVNLKTLPWKCWFGEPAIYCGAPVNQKTTTGANLVESSFKNGGNSTEDIYRIESLNIESGLRLAASPTLFNTTSVLRLNIGRIEKQNDSLLLLNENDHKLYSLPL